MREYSDDEIGLKMQIEDLEAENDRLRLWCDFRAQALIDIRAMCEPGSEISKAAGAALCFGPQRHPSACA